MKFEDTVFPVYRRYGNAKNFFKIISEKQFEEIQLVGTKKVVKKTVAERLPEIVFIRDLVEGRVGVEITEDEYEKMR
jgi:hypothetical protein